MCANSDACGNASGAARASVNASTQDATAAARLRVSRALAWRKQRAQYGTITDAPPDPRSSRDSEAVSPQHAHMAGTTRPDEADARVTQRPRSLADRLESGSPRVERSKTRRYTVG